MKRTLLTLTAACAVILTASGAKKMEKAVKNPFMEAYTTKYEIPPFDKIITPFCQKMQHTLSWILSNLR